MAFVCSIWFRCDSRSISMQRSNRMQSCSMAITICQLLTVALVHVSVGLGWHSPFVLNHDKQVYHTQNIVSFFTFLNFILPFLKKVLLKFFVILLILLYSLTENAFFPFNLTLNHLLNIHFHSTCSVSRLYTKTSPGWQWRSFTDKLSFLDRSMTWPTKHSWRNNVKNGYPFCYCHVLTKFLLKIQYVCSVGVYISRLGWGWWTELTL